MKKDVSTNNVAEQVSKLISVQNDSVTETIKGLYQGKPSLGARSLFTNFVKDLT